jgi:dUTPase
MEETNKKKVKVSPVATKSLAKDYISPNLYKVATEIRPDDGMFVPKYVSSDSSCVDLLANIKETLRLAHRGTATIDCGFSMKLPSGYKAEFSSNPALAARGLVVATGHYEDRVVVTVSNQGREIIVINRGDPIAQMSVEPKYTFDWMLEGQK